MACTNGDDTLFQDLIIFQKKDCDIALTPTGLNTIWIDFDAAISTHIASGDGYPDIFLNSNLVDCPVQWCEMRNSGCNIPVLVADQTQISIETSNDFEIKSIQNIP